MELKNIKRNKNGLLTGVKHKFTEDGLIDWAAKTESTYNLVRAVTKPYPGALPSGKTKS